MGAALRANRPFDFSPSLHLLCEVVKGGPRTSPAHHCLRTPATTEHCSVRDAPKGKCTYQLHVGKKANGYMGFWDQI